jgi:cellulose synthase/poly-beta-1,6-N-acetylglucosamine synthase-like glycosyltransferase
LLVLDWIFWLCGFGVVLAYVVYPVLVIYWPKWIPVVQDNPAFTPPVTVYLAAHNEAAVIRQKITTTFETTYPLDQITLLIGTDACTDETDQIIASLAAADSRIVHVPFAERTGKTGIINALRKRIQTPYAVATDANVFFQPDTLTRLLAPFIDERVGMVAGQIQYTDATKGIANQERTYLAWENRIKKATSDLWGITLGAEGGCFAVRTHLIPELPSNALVDDFFVTMTVLAGGHRIPFEPKASAFEDINISREVEFIRKARISAGNWQNLMTFAPLIWKNFYPVGMTFLVHKILRWLTPVLLLVMLVSAILQAPYSAFYQLFLLGAGCLGVGIFLDNQQYKTGKSGGFWRYPAHFFWMNLALLKGLLHYIKGVESGIWQRTQRNENEIR